MLNSTWLFRFLECLEPVKILNFFLLIDFDDHITPKWLELVFPKRDISIIRFYSAAKSSLEHPNEPFCKNLFHRLLFLNLRARNVSPAELKKDG